VVVPVYVTERCMPGVVVLHEGAWMDLDKNGVDRSGNPDFLTLDEPSPAGAFAYNTILVNIKKTDAEHRPGWDSRPLRAPTSSARTQVSHGPRNSTRRGHRAALERKVAQTYEPVKPAMQLGFIHHNVDCIGCRACEIACKDKNGLAARAALPARDVHRGRAYPDVFAYKVNMSCNHCAEPACLPTCPTGAIWKRRRTASSTSTRRCASAAACEAACPYGAPQWNPQAQIVSRNATCVSTRSMPAASPIA
jgi:Fe-S-cluster-containing hydrogenase component 2